MNTPILHLPYPTSADTADVPRDIQALALALDPLGTVPVGALALWPTAVAPSSAWLICQGQPVDAATYPALALVLGSSAGVITLPDFRDTFPMGAGAAALLSAGGANSVTLAANQNGQHNHAVTDPGHIHTATAGGDHNHGGGTGGASVNLDHEHDAGTYYPTSNPPVTWLGVQGSPGGALVPMALGGGGGYKNTSGGVSGGPGGLNAHGHGINPSGNHTHPVDSRQTGLTIQNSVAAQPHENRPQFRAINFIIRAL